MAAPFLTERKFNFPEGIYNTFASWFFYNQRKFNQFEAGISFLVQEGPTEEQKRRSFLLLGVEPRE